MRSLNPYEASGEGNQAVPAPTHLNVGWRAYFRLHLILVASTGVLVTLNGHHAFVKPPAAVIVPLVVALYSSLIFLLVSPVIDIYLLFKVVSGYKRCGMLFVADTVVTFGHFFFISPIIS